MTVYFMTGKLGGGKTLATIDKIQEKIAKGRPVATNVDLFMENYPNTQKKLESPVYRLPDKPSIRDMLMIGKGNESYDEEENGLIVLDELLTWFDSRTWNEKGRKELNSWFVMARKLGWDIMFIVQDISVVDSQLRKSLCEYLGICKNMKNVNIPILSYIKKTLTGKPLKMPKFHIVNIYQGSNETALKTDRWVFKSQHLYSFYDTKQVFNPVDGESVYSYLSPYHIAGRYEEQKVKGQYIKKINEKPFLALAALTLFTAAGFSAQIYYSFKNNNSLELALEDYKKQNEIVTKGLEKNANNIKNDIKKTSTIVAQENKKTCVNSSLNFSGKYNLSDKIVYKTKQGYTFNTTEYIISEDSNNVYVFSKDCEQTISKANSTNTKLPQRQDFKLKNQP